ncbi:hypothetical protein D3C72_1701140 [compost metagenome]
MGIVLHPQRGGRRNLPHQGAGDAIGEAHALVLAIHAGVETKHQQIGIQQAVDLGAGVLVAEQADDGDQHHDHEDVEADHLPATVAGMGRDGAGQGASRERGQALALHHLAIGQGLVRLIAG